MYVRVEVKRERQFVKIDSVDDITIRTFIKAVVDAFDLKNVHGKKVYIFDQLETRIDHDDLIKYLLKTNSENLVLKVEFGTQGRQSSRKSFGGELFTSNDIKDYLMKNGGKSILAEYNDKNNLSEPSRHKLVNILVDMLIERHGLYPPTIEKISIAKAALILFPKFKVNGTKYGIELFHDGVKSKGWFFSVLKARRRQAKQNQNEDNEPDENVDNNEIESSSEYTENDAKNDTEFLRTVVVNESNMALIEQKLRATTDYRKKICTDAHINILERFPYFFTHSELILLDFDIRFGIESNVFFDAWNKCKGNINNVLQLHKISNSTASGFDEEVDQFLSLLKLLPERQKGRKTAPMRLHFNDAIEKLVVYSKTGEPIDNALKDENKQPYIIMRGPSMTNITRYYIVIDSNCVNVDKKFSFIQTFDLLLKTHFVFHLSFDQHLMPLMDFIAHFFYKSTPQFSPTTHMLRVYNDITSED